MNLTLRHIRALFLAKATLVLFLLLTVVAMIAYPGGTNTNPHIEGYQFFQNFFSDLGRVTSFDGAPQYRPMLIFVSALTLAAIGQVLFYMMFPNFFRAGGRTLAFFGSFFGVMTGLGYLGIALTPWDMFGALHLHFVHVTFLSFELSVILYTIAIFRNPEYPNRYAWAFIAFCGVLTIYLVILFFGPKADTEWGLTVQVTAQKILIYCQAACVSFQVYGAIRIALKNMNPRSQTNLISHH
ncbi:hypothetical protein [Pseudobacteriovorax antillogorgiicola]|uniref:DUF998 domain-containing protein n=1 Tax=Pseudobacteriovorax antillogorgiicola TaxID=1513793 RepID=A0A1Y6CRK9_9BACT|nr:hypothetical protein [Pseudobacteriovorax antillogorgiicola]TCS45415.1 hypothetical protein EDD56_12826 [Pseudobacteriovorax antillogorgiicola]SMF74064.1 hypothetical protein SAMN06296036_12826 [Pseudobacteriovorax antillogorgiicola]